MQRWIKKEVAEIEVLIIGRACASWPRRGNRGLKLHENGRTRFMSGRWMPPYFEGRGSLSGKFDGVAGYFLERKLPTHLPLTPWRNHGTQWKDQGVDDCDDGLAVAGAQ